MNIMHFLTPKAQVAYMFKESTVRQGIEKMRYHGFSAIPVIDKEGKYVGTVTEGDFLWALYNNQHPSLKKLENTPLTSIIRRSWTRDARLRERSRGEFEGSKVEEVKADPRYEKYFTDNAKAEEE